MKYLCDANVISEPTKPLPSRRVVQWLRRNQAEWLIDAMVAAEIWNGIAKRDAGQRKTDLTEWFAGLKASVTCLDWTLSTACIWGDLYSSLRRTGRVVGVIDTMIAATALQHGLTVATRNVADFARCGVPVLNPWDE